MGNQSKGKKKILIVDDSALMRRVFCDIINNDERFEVADRAINGVDALEYLKRKSYDAVVLDIVMPKMDGLELMRQLNRLKIPARIMVVSTYVADGAKITLEALSLGALDFIRKPEGISECCMDPFKEKLLSILEVVTDGKMPPPETGKTVQEKNPADFRGKGGETAGEKIVAIATSTGGPRALQAVIPYLPAALDAPVLLVQHMPKGFTGSLAERLNSLSNLEVREAKEGDELQKGTVYVAMGGQHLTIRKARSGRHVVHYTDEPPREGVKPSANYMYESLAESDFQYIVCVVMTGMGADGTAGIRALKKHKNLSVITQSQESCTVYGMPGSVAKAGLSDKDIPLGQIAQEILWCVGVQKS